MVLPKRFVTGPGEIIAKGIGAISAKRNTSERKRRDGFERYLGIGCGVITKTVLETLEFSYRTVRLVCIFIFEFCDPSDINDCA